MAGVLSGLFRKQFSTSSRLLQSSGGDHGGAMKMWRNITYFVAFPAIGLGMVNAYLVVKEDEAQERVEFIPYEHLRIRTKRFPWGDGNHSLFHNPHTNPLPDGYETVDH